MGPELWLQLLIQALARRLDLAQNKTLRIITGAAKSTTILAMQLQVEIESLKDRQKKNAIIPECSP